MAQKAKMRFNESERALGRNLALDELFDLTLYQKLAKITRGRPRLLLKEIIPVEDGHYNFWKEFFNVTVDSLTWGGKAKLWVLYNLCRIFGDKMTQLILEAIEIYGTRKYLNVWQKYKNTELAHGLKGILDDEFKHEDVMVSKFIERKIEGGRIRNVFLGMNDGLVEILGAVNGFFAAFSNVSSVLMAGLTVAVAGAISMGAGVYVASSSEKEVEAADRMKKIYLKGKAADEGASDRPLSSAFIVGIFYLMGAMVPVLPVLAGAKSVVVSLVMGGAMLVVVSFVVAFLSGMNVRKRILMNLTIMVGAIIVTYALGTAVRRLWGIEI